MLKLAAMDVAKLTYDDFVRFPDDGRRHELIDGEHYVTPSPNWPHQWVSKRLFRYLEDYFEPRGLGTVFYAPLDVILSRHDVVEPDVLVARPSQLTGQWIDGPPLLAIEILSPSSARADRYVKFRRYAEFGIDHYWIADPNAQTIECYRVREERYDLIARAAEGEPLTHPDFPGLSIPTDDLWAAK